jgi:hypothetical protein
LSAMSFSRTMDLPMRRAEPLVIPSLLRPAATH